MLSIVVTMLMLSAPHPVTSPTPKATRKVVVVERSPAWGRDPVVAAKFMTLAHQSRESQLAALEHGRKVAADYDLRVARNRMPIVGQVQQSYSVSVSSSITRAVPAGFGNGDQIVPLTPGNIGTRH